MLEYRRCGGLHTVSPANSPGGNTIDAYLNLISVRVVREYTDHPIPDDKLRAILQAGRATGSSVNRQQWKFYVVRSRESLAQLADSVYAPHNVATCTAAIAVATSAKSSFDVGRCSQNMILAAWDAGIGSCPNGVKDAAAAAALLGMPEDESIGTVLSLGYPLRPFQPRAGDVEGIIQRIKRKPLDELVVWVDEGNG